MVSNDLSAVAVRWPAGNVDSAVATPAGVCGTVTVSGSSLTPPPNPISTAVSSGKRTWSRSYPGFSIAAAPSNRTYASIRLSTCSAYGPAGSESGPVPLPRSNTSPVSMFRTDAYTGGNPSDRTDPATVVSGSHASSRSRALRPASSDGADAQSAHSSARTVNGWLAASTARRPFPVCSTCIRTARTSGVVPSIAIVGGPCAYAWLFVTADPTSGMEYPEVRETDPAVADALEGEVQRQQDTLAMIASENHVSEAVLEAQGSALTNKYAEGYPGTRYYAGCEFADDVEELAIERAKELWGAEHVNVQPHSGTQANMAVYLATLEPGDKILSLELEHGGHLSHGHPANFTGQLFEVEQYGVDTETGYIDYEALAQQAAEYDPDIIVSGFSAYPREVEWERIQAVADDVDAYHLADIAHITGLVAAGVHASPVGVADFVTGSTHKTIRAGRGGIIMCDEAHASDIDSAVFPGGQGGPLMHNIAGKAVGFGEALEPEFDAYAQQVIDNAAALAESFEAHGLEVVSGGTDTHLVLVDLRESHPDTTGGDAEEALADAGIVLNANTVPGETRSAFNPSGIRAGTPALTTRGFDEEACREVGDLIYRVVDNGDDEAVIADVRDRVDELTDAHPLYK
jgi:glycine hydroxymethyltransferase